MPLETRSGSVISPNASSFFLARVKTLAISYLVLDFLSTFLTQDPYFVSGTKTSGCPLPPWLARIHPSALTFVRGAIVLVAVYWAVTLVLTSVDLLQYVIGGHYFAARRDAWYHASIFGGFHNVLDRGLAGFWGGWWHQTFRVPFIAPVTWLVRKGYLEQKSTATKTAAMCSAFVNSALLHTAGSLASAPDTKLYRPSLFFFLSAMGIFAQQAFCHLFASYIQSLADWSAA